MLALQVLVILCYFPSPKGDGLLRKPELGKALEAGEGLHGGRR